MPASMKQKWRRNTPSIAANVSHSSYVATMRCFKCGSIDCLCFFCPSSIHQHLKLKSKLIPTVLIHDRHYAESATAAFDFPDNEYPTLGVQADAYIDMYTPKAYRWMPRCNRKKNLKECIKMATCGANIPGKAPFAPRCVCVSIYGLVSPSHDLKCRKMTGTLRVVKKQNALLSSE